MSWLFGKAFDYNDFVKQVRGYTQGHPQVLKSNRKDPQSGITITGTGAGELFVSTESYTPAGVPGSPAASPGPGTLYRLTCTTAGSAITSPKAAFTVEQIGVSPSVLGTLTAGTRFKPDGDIDPINSPQLNSPKIPTSPFTQHGLELILTTTTDWAVSDTIEFRLVNHDWGRPGGGDNFVEQRYYENAEDGNGDYITEWIARVPSIAQAAASPEFQYYTGLLSSFNDSASEYNVRVMGANQFISSNAFGSQGGTSGLRSAFLSNIPFNFWLTGDADGFYAAARLGSVYEHITCQLIDVFATGNQHPLPMYVGAMSEENNHNATETDNDVHAAWWDPGITSTARFRWVDGTWYDVQNRTSVYAKSFGSRNRYIVPWVSLDSASDHTDGDFSSTMDWNRLSHQMLARYDGSYELVPATLIITNPQSAVIGDLKYVKYVTGNGLNAEDTTTDTSVSPQVEYIALQNAQLSNNDNFCVMELMET